MKKTIGIGITGGIACYKLPHLVSLLKKADYEVVVIMTAAAQQFVTPLTFQAISGRPVATDMWTADFVYKIPHIDLAKEVDMLLIAPATADFIAKMAHGQADDLLSAVVLANTKPLLVAPAMNTDMFNNAAVQENIAILERRGSKIIHPDAGDLACGVSGVGRLPEPEELFSIIDQYFSSKASQDLRGYRIMVNAGTTCEDIDPVRYIGNRASGKMGFALAHAAARRGADVVLVSGLSALTPPPGAKFIKIWGVEEMLETMSAYQKQVDVIIGAAAVGDFKVKSVAGDKIKKDFSEDTPLILELTATPDILKTLSATKPSGQIMVGFAAETQDVVNYARKKLKEKRLDLIVANDVGTEGAGFGTDTNIVTLIDSQGNESALPILNKTEVANIILDKVIAIKTVQNKE